MTFWISISEVFTQRVSGDLLSLSFPIFENLTTIDFGEESFSEVATLSISGLNKLQSLTFRKNSFTYSKNSYAERKDRQLTIKNCSELTSISFGDYSFSDYHSIELQNLDSLISVTFGQYCFYYSNFNFSCMFIRYYNDCFNGLALPSLIQFNLGEYAFSYAEEIYLKSINDPDNHDGVIPHLEPHIHEGRVKWALGIITMNKAS